MFFAIGLALPFITGQIPQIGQMLIPMHIPVLLCSLLVGWKYGLVIGVLIPITRSLLFQMPQLYPNAVAMMFELAAYGLCAGLLYRLFLKLNWDKAAAVFVSLIIAMLLGRVVWGVASYILMGLKGNTFTLDAFVAGAFLKAVPGIILQLILVPAVVIAFDKTENNA